MMATDIQKQIDTLSGALATLKDLRELVESPRWRELSCSSGICIHLEYFAVGSRLKRYIESWPEFSGDHTYPVPPTIRGYTALEQFESRRSHNWSPRSKYGQSRRRLLTWLIECFEKDLKKLLRKEPPGEFLRPFNSTTKTIQVGPRGWRDWPYSLTRLFFKTADSQHWKTSDRMSHRCLFEGSLEVSDLRSLIRRKDVVEIGALVHEHDTFDIVPIWRRRRRTR